MFKVHIIGIGAKKAGTTWLADCMRQHPEICVSEPKEVNYFNKIYHSPGRPNKQFNKSLFWYKHHWRHRKRGQMLAEFSVHYLGDLHAPKRIKETFPDAKLIVCLRNPIDRAYSHYWMCRSYLRTEKGTFEQALRKNNRYTYEGLYNEHLTRYMEFFDKHQIHVVFMDDIKKQPQKVLEQAFRFIGVDPYVAIPNHLKRSNASKYTRTKFTEKTMHYLVKLALQLNMHWLVQQIRGSRIKASYVSLTTKPFRYPKMKEHTRKYLQEFYSKDIKKLETLLKKDLSHWT